MNQNSSQQQVLTPQVGAKNMVIESQVIKDTEDPKTRYRKELEEIISAKQGEISALDLKILEALRIRIGLSLEEAFDIRHEVLSPYQEYKKRLTEYRKAFVEAIRRESLIRSDTRNGLKRLQELLNLQDEDIATLESQLLQKRKGSEGNKILILAGVISLILLAGISSWIAVSLLSPARQQIFQNPVGSQQRSVRG